MNVHKTQRTKEVTSVLLLVSYSHLSITVEQVNLACSAKWIDAQECFPKISVPVTQILAPTLLNKSNFISPRVIILFTNLGEHGEDFCQSSITDPDLATIEDIMLAIRGQNCFGFDRLSKNEFFFLTCMYNLSSHL